MMKVSFTVALLVCFVVPAYCQTSLVLTALPAQPTVNQPVAVVAVGSLLVPGPVATGAATGTENRMLDWAKSGGEWCLSEECRWRAAEGQPYDPTAPYWVASAAGTFTLTYGAVSVEVTVGE